MKALKELKQKLSRGSILVFTLLVMFILLISALGIASVTVIERKTSGTTGKSTQSFQVADSGAEIVLQKIYKDSALTDIASMGGCSSGQVSGSIDVAGEKNYTVTFYDVDDNKLTCTDNVSDVRLIKSVGSYAQTSRAIEVAVAQTAGSWLYLIDSCKSLGCTASVNCGSYGLTVGGYSGTTASTLGVSLGEIDNIVVSFGTNCSPSDPIGTDSFSCQDDTTSSPQGAAVTVICS